MILAPLLAVLSAAASPVEPAPPRVSAPAIAAYLAARRAEGEGNLPRALADLDRALTFDRGAAQLRLARALLLARLARPAEAEEEARRALALDGEGEVAVESWTLLGRIAGERRDLPAATGALRRAAALELKLATARGPEEDRSPDPEPWRILGRLQLEAGDERGAAETWADLGRQLPAESARGYREMARSALEARDPARAERLLRTAVDAYPSDLEAWKRLAQLQERRRAIAEARTSWEAALRADTEDLDALAALGRLSLRAGDLPGAQAYLRQLRAADPDEVAATVLSAMALLEARRGREALAVLDGLPGPPEARLSFARGLALEELRRWPEAAEAFAAVGPGEGELWGSARMNRGYALAQAGHNAEALEVLDQALLARPRDVRLITTRAFVLERLGRADEAARGLERALAARGRGPGGGDEEGQSDLYDALAQSLARAGRAGEAVAVLRAAVAARPRDPELVFALGVAEERAGDMTAALARMQGLLEIDPEHAEALNFVGYAWAEQGVRLDEAERLIERALEQKPDNGYFLDSLGWVHYRRGDPARAAPLLEKADAAAGPEPTILEHLGDAYASLGRAADAEQAYRRALRSLDAGEAPDGPERAARQRAGLLRKLGSKIQGAARPPPAAGSPPAG